MILVLRRSSGALFMREEGDAPMAENKTEGLSREKLADGNVLVSVKERFRDDMTDENLMELMQLLRDSVLILPMRVIMSAADEERMRLYDENMKLVIENEVQVVPATVVIEDKNYLFIFSQAEQIPVEYSDTVTLMKAPFPKVYQYLMEDESIDGTVLDPFSEDLELPRELMGAIAQMPSRLIDET